MPMRCPSSFQQAYRDVAARHGCIFIDGQSYFHAIGRHGLLDDELFQDAMHPSLRGQIALAQAVLVALQKRHAFGWPADSPDSSDRPVSMCQPFWNRQERLAINRHVVEGIQRSGYPAPVRSEHALAQAERRPSPPSNRSIAGVAPEKVGLPNVGTPAGIPVIDNLTESSSEIALPITPCLTE